MRIIITLMMNLLLLETGFSQTTDEGEINGAKFFIEIPKDWNGGLVMYAHGYEETDEYVAEEVEEEFEEKDEEEEDEEFSDIFTSRGFAFAASEYRAKGLVIKEGVEDTEALRAYFGMKYGKPSMTIMTGHSMGGMITIATIEGFSSEYQGALPLCGYLGPVHSLMKSGLDMLVTFDYLFGPNDGKLVEGPEMIPEEKLEQYLSTNKKMIDRFAEHFRIRNEHLPAVLYFFQGGLKETSGLLGGRPVGNVQTIYDGFGFGDDGLNKGVRRYSADPDAVEYVLNYNTPTGKIADPVIAMHTTYDELIPASNYDYYQQATIINNTNHLYRQKYVVRDGHCFFTNEEVAESFDQLLEWVKTGKSPEYEYK